MPRDAPPTSIRAASAAPLDIPLNVPFGISRGSLDRAANVLFTVELLDGSRGFGEAAPFPAYNGETQAAALGVLQRGRGPDPRQGRRRTGGRLPPISRPSRGQDADPLLCALETALIDALGRSSGFPALEVLRRGGNRASDGHDGDDGDPRAGPPRRPARFARGASSSSRRRLVGGRGRPRTLPASRRSWRRLRARRSSSMGTPG